ncbi:FadR/GntR family transcriptional regulator [Variovorax sp. N23]|uniref:FadR/GntR family transcriptional regulator n=1 Tax=Variovorax sp. N23 TaxID=2980555 RepID=UPI0021C90868|nr:GntR family transcriptional regulator [Variovorax sp. N23]MCU4118984.1 GntR family transcriptional regulator [Variovorax sp. N23]
MAAPAVTYAPWTTVSVMRPARCVKQNLGVGEDRNHPDDPDDDMPIAGGTRARSARGSLALSLVDELGRRMRLGPLHTGDRLPTEAALKKEFGVSRTVVREALSRLGGRRQAW